MVKDNRAVFVRRKPRKEFEPTTKRIFIIKRNVLVIVDIVENEVERGDKVVFIFVCLDESRLKPESHDLEEHSRFRLDKEC